MANALFVSVALGMLIGQVAPIQPRDTRPAATRTGTATIRGRVYNADTGLPLRRVVVALMAMSIPAPLSPPGASAQAAPSNRLEAVGGGMPGPPRNVLTDGAGRFEFTGLPAGSYRVRASPNPNQGVYLPASFGARDPMSPGQAIELKDGESFEQANVPLQRGGAIVGRIMDESGEPLSRVSVYPSRIAPGTGTFQRVGGGFIQSDDHGRYRIYGLEPGDYIVAAEGRGMGMAGPQVESIETEGFVTTFHPATPNDREATRVRVRASSDTEGIDIHLVRTRTFRITGTVMDSQGRQILRPMAQLTRQTSSGFSTGSGFGVDQQGRFTIRDVVPGDYTLIVRPGSFGEPTPQGGPPQNQEYAAVPLSVAADIENLVVVTQPGVTVSGQVVFADGEPPTTVGGLRVTTQPAARLPMFGPPPSGPVGADHRFTLTNLFGAQLIRLVPLRREWALKAIMLGATDITDTPVEFTKEHSGHLQIVVSTRPALIEGTVTGDDGAPVEQAMVLIFPEDKDSWKVGSPRVRTAMSMNGGKYSSTGLIGGRYFAVALPFRSVMMTPDTPPDFFERLAKDATRLVVADDERRVVDLRLSKAPD